MVADENFHKKKMYLVQSLTDFQVFLAIKIIPSDITLRVILWRFILLLEISLRIIFLLSERVYMLYSY